MKKLSAVICTLFLLLFGANQTRPADVFKNPSQIPAQDYQFEDIQEFIPGTYILLPNGESAIIEEYLENGDLRTNHGIIISREGTVKEGPDKGYDVVLDPAWREKNSQIIKQAKETNINKSVLIKDKETTIKEKANNTPNIIKPVQTQIAKPNAVSGQMKQDDEKLAQKNKESQIPQNTAPVKENTSPNLQSEKGLTLAQMLPMTTIQEKGQAKKSPIPIIQEKNSAKGKKEDTNALPHKSEKKDAPKKDKPVKPEKAEKQPSPVKTGVGQPLRIPPESIKSGKLDFLEGCWQGTRPEYVSKRTVRECFCFSSGGKSGRRWIHDSIGGRQCIGPSKATLSSSGVLSVTSSDMPCTDGERWGGAEMVCKNSGPRTPCSWIFTDANNGRQAYEIPFVRVESCRR